MPVFNEKDTSLVTVSPQNVKPTYKAANTEEDAPSAWEVAAATFRQETTVGSVGSFISKGGFLGPRKNLGYDSVSPLKGTKYEQYAERFFDADSDEDVNIIKARIDQEEKDRDVIARGGGMAIAAGLAAGILDPINLLPVGGFIAKGVKAAKVAKASGGAAKSALGIGATTAAVGGVSSAASEAVLQGTQEVRPIEESLTNIGVSTFLSGILGGSIAGVSNALTKKVARDLSIDDTVKGTEAISASQAEEAMLVNLNPQSVGAAALKKTTLEDETIQGVLAQNSAKLFKKLNPTFNLAQSQSLEARKVGQQIIEGPFVLQKNAEGVETPIAVETRVKLYDAAIGGATQDLNGSFKEYKSRIKNIAPGENEVPLDFKNFKDQVALAMIQGDVHPIKEVEKVAKSYRQKIFDPLLKEAKSVGLLPENVEVKTAQSYLTRIYDQGKITANRPGLKKILEDWLPGQIQKDLDNIGTLQEARSKMLAKMEGVDQSSGNYKKLESQLSDIEGQLENYRVKQAMLEEGDVGEIADEIIAHIQGQKDGLVFYSKIPMTKGPLKERVLDIPDELIREYLVTDIEEVASRYTKTVAPDIEIQRAFGSLDLKDQLGKIRKEYDDLINNAKTTKERQDLVKARNNDLEDIRAITGRLRGTYGRPLDADHWIYTGLQTARTLNYTTKLGGMTASSIPDLGRLVAIRGVTPIFKDGLIPLITNFKSFKMSAKEAKLAGAAWDVALNNSKSISVAELVDPVNRGNRIRMGLNALTDKFTKATLAPYFDSAKKQFASVLIQNKNIEDIEKLVVGKLDKEGITDLAKNGIGKDMAERIHKMWKQFGEKKGLLKIANTEMWTDKDALIAYRAALNKQISFFSTMPGIGDRPRWMSTEIGKTIGQFESFNLAATSKILVSGMQGSKLKSLQALTTSIGLGMGAYAYKQWANGHDVSDDPKEWIIAGVDNSGVAGILGSVNDRLSKLSGGSINAARLVGVDRPEYRIDATKNVAGLLGPTVGMAGDVATLFKLFNEKNSWNYKDTRAIRRLIPFQNLLGIRKLFDEVESGINESLGITGGK